MQETADQTFVALGEEIPPPVVVPVDLSFVTWRQSGKIATLAGHGPNKKTSPPQFDYVGRVGGELTQAEGQEAARLCGLGLLVTLRAAVGALDRVSQVLQMTGAVSSMSDFFGQSYVLNSASDLMTQIFGSAIVRPARMAFGVVRLPFNMAVEVSMTTAVD